MVSNISSFLPIERLVLLRRSESFVGAVLPCMYGIPTISQVKRVPISIIGVVGGTTAVRSSPPNVCIKLARSYDGQEAIIPRPWRCTAGSSRPHVLIPAHLSKFKIDVEYCQVRMR